MPKTIVGIMGPGENATADDCARAYELGRQIALEGWVVLTGGRARGVMDSALRGAKEAGGLTVGILPTTDPEELSIAVDIPILSGLGEARNYVNILTSEVVFVCGMNAGTASEAALAIKAGRPVIFLAPDPATVAFFNSFGSPLQLHNVSDVSEAVLAARSHIRRT